VKEAVSISVSVGVDQSDEGKRRELDYQLAGKKKIIKIRNI